MIDGSNDTYLCLERYKKANIESILGSSILFLSFTAYKIHMKKPLLVPRSIPNFPGHHFRKEMNIKVSLTCSRSAQESGKHSCCPAHVQLWKVKLIS